MNLKFCLIILLFFITSVTCAQTNLRKDLPGVWKLDSVYTNGKKADHSIYLQTIEFTMNGRILLGTGTYNYKIQGDSVIFNYGDNDVRKLVSLTSENLVLSTEAYGEMDKKYLWTDVFYYSRKKK